VRITDLRDDLPTSGAYTSGNRRSHIVIHHSDTPPMTTPLAIARYHLGKGDPGIAYHYLVYHEGTVYQCNDDEAETWHAGGGGWENPLNANHYSLGICLVGDFTDAPPPPAQLQAARELVAHLRGKYGPMQVLGHGEAYMTSTACPGDTWPEWRGYLEATMHVGFHGGNGPEPTATDWRIQETVKPGCFWFLPDEGTQPDHIRRLLGINPGMHIGIRPYYIPGSELQPYLDQCKRAVDKYRDAIPDGQRHLQLFNEPNMPAWAQWEGFGDQLADMQKFDDWFCAGYSQLKRHDPTWRVGWTPLTPGNRDAWFKGDMPGHYYMHGPSGCVESLTETRRKAAIDEGPCKASLLLADEYYAHVYIHEGRDAYKEPWRGLRFERYRQFFPKPLDVWITEAGFPNRSSWPDWGDAALVDWLNVVSQRNVAGIALWILGDKPQWGSMWYEGGEPRQAVYTLRDWLEDRPIIVEEAPVTQTELTEATNRRNLLPASMKACDARGYSFKSEWFAHNALYALGYNPADGKYHCLKMDTGTWQVVEDVAL
jgi:hypothetical protein